MIRILFVCTGNTCRSPMAEGLLRDRLPEDMKGKVEVTSAGIFASRGAPATESAVEALSETGVDIRGHRSTQVSSGLVAKADLIVAMTEAHAAHIISAWPDAHDRLIVLGALDRGRDDPDIRDPIGGGSTIYRDARDEIDGLVEKLVGYISERFVERLES
ncbi:MAG TPA: low molecular weight protein arginine phosphatase [Candidatus Krumholzibacterium sp.]|nr:low molecular weight protein arginine phosphatase [Candidatus Krumholzibacterium sp.]